MTDSLLQKLEEKVITLLTELEDLRKEVHRVKQENTLLKTDKVNHTEKLHGLIALLETIDLAPQPSSAPSHSFSEARTEEVATF